MNRNLNLRVLDPRDFTPRMRLQHVTAPSALATSLASTVATCSPRRWRRSSVRGKDVRIDDPIAEFAGRSPPTVRPDGRRCGRIEANGPVDADGSHAGLTNKRFVADRRGRGLQVQAAVHVNRRDLVAERRQHTAHVIDAGIVCPARSSDQHLTADHEHVAAVDGRRRLHLMKRPIFPQARRRHRRSRRAWTPRRAV